MPKVSQQHRDARRQQILDAAGRCFLRSGFQGTSMQDLLAESHLSSGAFYLYFKSKDDVIVAIAEQNLSEVTSLIHDLAVEPHPEGLGEALASVLETIRRKHAEHQLGAITVLVWSEAQRTPHLRDRFAESVARMRADLTLVVAQHQQSGTLPGSVPAEALAKLLMAIVPGVVLQLAMFGDQAVDGVPDAARAIWPG